MLLQLPNTIFLQDYQPHALNQVEEIVKVSLQFLGLEKLGHIAKICFTINGTEHVYTAYNEWALNSVV